MAASTSGPPATPAPGTAVTGTAVVGSDVQSIPPQPFDGLLLFVPEPAVAAFWRVAGGGGVPPLPAAYRTTLPLASLPADVASSPTDAAGRFTIDVPPGAGLLCPATQRGDEIDLAGCAEVDEATTSGPLEVHLGRRVEVKAGA